MENEVKPLSKLWKKKNSIQRFGILTLVELLEILGNERVNHFGQQQKKSLLRKKRLAFNFLSLLKLGLVLILKVYHAHEKTQIAQKVMKLKVLVLHLFRNLLCITK